MIRPRDSIYYPLPCEESDLEPKRKKAKIDSKACTFFERLLPDLKGQIVAKMDHPTQMAFSWTCRTYCRLYFKPEKFDRYKFLDRCAISSYRELIAESVEQYGFRVDIVMICKAALHGHSYAELWKPYLRNVISLGGVIRNAFSDPATWAVRGGNLNLSEALADCSRHIRGIVPALDAIFLPASDEWYANGHLHWPPNDLIFYLAEGGHLDLAEIVYANLSDRQIAAMSRKQFIQVVFEGAANSGNLPLVNWCIEQSSDILAEDVIICVEANDLRAQSCLNFLMVRGMTYGIVEFCRLAREKGWQPSSFCPISHLKHEIFRHPKFIPGSNHLECIQYLDTQCEDPHKGDYLEEEIEDYDPVPRWATIEGLNWLREHGYMPNLQALFDEYCKHGHDLVKGVLRSKIPMSQFVGWFIERGVNITLNTYICALAEERLNLLDALWEMNPKALPGEALRGLIEEKIDHWQQNKDLDSLNCVSEEVRKYHRCFCPYKSARRLLRIVKWLLAKGMKLEGLQDPLDELALAMMRIEPRAAQLFCRDREIHAHLSERCRNIIFPKIET